MKRRAFLATVGTLATAGCVSRGASDSVFTSIEKPDPIQRKRSSRPEQSSRTKQSSRTSQTEQHDQQDGVMPVKVSADDRSVSNTQNIFAELRTAWAAETRQSIQPANRDKYYYAAPPDRKFVVVMFRVQNISATDSKIALTPRMFGLAVPSSDENPANYHHRPLEYLPNPFEGVSLRQGATTEGWMVYSIPASITRAELFVPKGLFPGPVEVEFDRGTVDIPDM